MMLRIQLVVMVHISTLYLEIRELLRLSCMGMVIPFLKSLMFLWSVI